MPKNDKTKKLDWLDEFKKKEMGGMVVYRLGFTQKFLRTHRPIADLESLREQTIVERRRVIEDAKRQGHNPTYWYHRSSVGSMFSEVRKCFRKMHADSFDKTKLYRTKSPIYGDIKTPGWGYYGWKHVPKGSLMTYVGKTRLDEPLFMLISGTNSTNDYIKVGGSMINKIVEVENADT